MDDYPTADGELIEPDACTAKAESIVGMEITFEPCSMEPPEPEVTYSELMLTYPEVTVKGMELRCENGRHWSVIEWEPSYWTSNVIFNANGWPVDGVPSHAETVARMVFWQYIGKWTGPADPLIPASPARRAELAMASYRCPLVAEGLLLPPPWQQQPSDDPWDDTAIARWLEGNINRAQALGHSTPPQASQGDTA